MAEEFETVELEYSEDDILYFLEDEEGTEIGFAIEEDGKEVEYFYEGFDADDYEFVSEPGPESASKPQPESVSKPKPTAAEKKPKPTPAKEAAETKDHGYLYKLAVIAGHEGNKTRKKAGEKLDVARDVAGDKLGKAKEVATEQAGKAKAKAKETADEAGISFSKEDVAETTADLNALAREGAETAKELKEAYDDIMESFGFMVPKNIRRKLP